MRRLHLFGLFVFSVITLAAQENSSTATGRVSYVTSQHVYVKFNSTKNISTGDTLYLDQNGKPTPALVVSALSSISCVCTPLPSVQVKKDDNIVFIKRKTIKTPVPVVTIPPVEPPEPEPEIVKQKKTADTTVPEKTTYRQRINGRLSVSSYSNFSNTPVTNLQRMRYTFSLKADNIAGSKFSAETYLSFVHSNRNWGAVKENIMNSLKIYNLVISYQPVKQLNIWLGRRINPNMSNVGAIDGLQIESNIKSFIIGAFVGSRPDYTDYGFNFNLLQFGGYVGHVYKNKKHREMRTILAFVEQQNSGATDRRFVYLQHFNQLVKNLYFFGTAEIDLYQNIDTAKQSLFNRTNLYFSLRYRIIRQLSFSVGYSARHTPIYYETYKDYIQRLIDEETLQGFRLQISYRPVRYLSLGARVGYRMRKDDPRDSKNAYVWVTYSQIPGINASLTLSATFLQSAFLSGGIYSAGLSKYLINGKLYAGIGYRYVDYNYSYMDSGTAQNVGDASLTWKIIRPLSFSVSYEGVFENKYTYNRIYANLSWRF